MLFNFQRKKKHNVCSLDIFNAKNDEPRSSVMDSSDYDFALQKYTETDFRYKFVQEYMKHIEFVHGIKIFNCKFERPQPDSDFLNFYIYLWKDDPNISYRIEDPHYFYITAFYKVLSENPLPSVTKELHIQFLLKNVWSVMYGKVLDLTWHDIHLSISGIFPEIADMSYWSNLYIFIKSDEYEKVVKTPAILSQIKQYCYNNAVEHDIHNILDFDQFHIRVDNYENYQSIGGYNYFNSDFMFNCLLY